MLRKKMCGDYGVLVCKLNKKSVYYYKLIQISKLKGKYLNILQIYANFNLFLDIYNCILVYVSISCANISVLAFKKKTKS